MTCREWYHGWSDGLAISLNKCIMFYSLRSILVATNIDVSRYILVLGTSIRVISNMNRWEYCSNSYSRDLKKKSYSRDMENVLVLLLSSNKIVKVWSKHTE
jgi:hypothetical protein